MRLSRLRLTGFKSFVDPTDLVIADGLTGVVGPNGCGKSNLLEALRWVMGEGRPSAMRGGGMEDVIFAGAASRPARSFAEVALVVDDMNPIAAGPSGDTDEIEVVRRITRDAGSAYRLGGRDVRARDVQMLFADASTGAHSPSLVRQGQISELINAKPQARRRVLEEAAGISGLYQRRHEAELRLGATAANLARLDDVIEALAAQLGTLVRQARQAAKYREIGVALRAAEGLLLWRRWTATEGARATAEAELRARGLAVSTGERAARASEDARAAAEAAMPGLREEAAVAGAILQRLSVARENLAAREARARAELAAVEARAVRLDADAAREEALDRDAGASVAELEAEALRLGAEGAGDGEALTVAQDAARAAAADLSGQESEMSRMSEDLARLSARHLSVGRMAEEVETRLKAVAAEAEGAAARAEAARGAVAEAEQSVRAAGLASARSGADATAAEATLGRAEAAREAAQDGESRARTARAGAEGEAGALEAEVGALTRLLARDVDAGASLLDRVEVVPGFEAAFGAAFGDDLRSGEVGGESGTGWVVLPPVEGGTGLPEGVAALAAQVTAPGVLARRLGQIGIVAAGEASSMQARLSPGQALVSLEGDLWRWDGYRASAEAAPSAAALRLRQVNRLASLRQDTEEAARRAEGMRVAHEALSAKLGRCREDENTARKARREADRALSEAGRARAGAEGAQASAASRLEVAVMAVSRLEAEAAEGAAARGAAEAARAELAPLETARAALDAVRGVVEGARVRMMALRAEADGLGRAREARVLRAAQVASDLDGWRARRDAAGARLGELAARSAEIETERAAARDAPETLAVRRAALAQEIVAAEVRGVAAGEALATGETVQRDAVRAAREAERAAGEAREVLARAEVLRDAAGAALAQAAARIAEALDCTPEELRAALDAEVEAMTEECAVEARVAELRRQRDALGAVNLRAEADAADVRAEHDTLAGEKADLDQAVAELRAGIADLNREGRQRLLEAFETVNARFGTLFRHLFSGGEARLELVESDDPLEAGLEIMCQPPGKKLSSLSLLSGGEQTLTALALIFAVFLANPAPICVLDEVDAPLDDANVTRFCDMLDEMVRRTPTRFLVITHHAVTMARMHRLYGVTMVEPGVSQLVSVDLGQAEGLVA